MSFTIDTEFTPLGAEPSEAAVSVQISDGDLRRLYDLATLAGVGGPGAGSFAELLSATLHRGTTFVVPELITVVAGDVGDDAA